MQASPDKCYYDLKDKENVENQYDKTCETKKNYIFNTPKPSTQKHLQFYSDNQSQIFSSAKQNDFDSKDLERIKMMYLDDEQCCLSSNQEKIINDIPKIFNSNQKLEDFEVQIQREDSHAKQWKQWAQQNHNGCVQNKVVEDTLLPFTLNSSSNEKIKYKSAFKLFKLDQIVEVKSTNPDINFKERLQLLKDMWKILRKEEKSIYVQRSRLEKEKALIKLKEDQLLLKQSKQ